MQIDLAALKNVKASEKNVRIMKQISEVIKFNLFILMQKS